MRIHSVHYAVRTASEGSCELGLGAALKRGRLTRRGGQETISPRFLPLRSCKELDDTYSPLWSLELLGLSARVALRISAWQPPDSGDMTAKLVLSKRPRFL